MVRLRHALLALTASAALGGCAYGYGDYGYGGVSVGYGSGGYYDGYGDYGYAPYYGWYDDYYYPGAGYYIYDRGGHRHKWNDHHRRYWEGRGHGRDGQEHWADYRREGGDRGNGGQGRRDGENRGEWQGRRDGDNRGEWQGRQGDGRRAEGQSQGQGRQDGGRRTYRDVRGPEAYAGNAPAAGTATTQTDAAPAAAARPETASRGAWRNAQREQRAGNGDQQRASRNEGTRQARSNGNGSEGRRGGGGEGRHGGRGPRD